MPTVLTAQLCSFIMLHIVDNEEIIDSLYENGWQQKPLILKEKIVNWAAGGGHINALECAQD